jgi:hypothetical protein
MAVLVRRPLSSMARETVAEPAGPNGAWAQEASVQAAWGKERVKVVARSVA